MTFLKISKDHGFTLIEVLIAVLILASGMLGISAIQSRSLSYGQIAYFNNTANALGYDMLDRIKANRVVSVDGAGYTVAIGSIPTAYPNDCVVGTCTPAELASYDVNQWKFIVNRQLPNGDGSITFTDTPEGRSYTITIFFDDIKGATSSRRSIVLQGGV
ncbi:type IV pilus modification protein PilV [Endozoicomonas atrinae]|uniref:type IV pilus modification protein PilV n=1 Tax=Endozoicomonas atrinae TaxID=1333660 RepID=UPI0009F47597|nr:type IV pilus modification protein PilV [Endozoicomonas atrinae]